MSANRTVGVSVLVDGSQATETFTELESNVAGVGAAAQTSSGAASQAFTDMGAAAQGAATGTMSLSAQIAINKQRLADMNAQIKETISDLGTTEDGLAAVTAEMGAESAAAERVSATYAQLQGTLETQVAAKTALQEETDVLV